MRAGRRARLLLATLAVALAPSMAQADHPFILPSATNLSGPGNTATFDAAGSDHVFFFDHRPLALDTIAIARPDNTAAEPMNAVRTRFRSVFDLKLDGDGTWKVTSRQAMVTGTATIGGEERRVGGRGGPPPGSQPAQGAPAGMRNGDGNPRRQPPIALKDLPADATNLHLTEIVNTAETFVTNGAPTIGVFTPSGSGLEFQPITHPNALAAGETARFRFLVDGRPAAGVKVSVLRGGDRYRDGDEAMQLATGADGTVAVRWPMAGMYLLSAETEDAHPQEKRAEARRMIYSATLEVMTP